MILEIFKTITFLMLFLIVSLIAFTAPGFGLLKLFRINLFDNVEKYSISTILGIVVFTLTSYLSVIFHVRFMLWIVPILGIFLLIKNFKNIFLSNKFKLGKPDIIYFFLILFFGIVTQVAINAPSGFNFGGNLLFWSAQGRDGMWHIALMEEMKRNIFPFQNPEYAGYILKNYHFFVDLLMSDVSRMFRFSNLDIYFRFFPILFSLLLGLSSFVFVRYWSKNKTAGLWAMIFTYFAGSFGYIVTLIRNETIGGETIFWMNQTSSVLGNPPQACAFIIFIGFLFLLLRYLRSREIQYLILAGLLGGVTIEFKVYGGLIILGALFVLGVYELIFKKKYQIILLFVSVLIISSILYFPNSSGATGFVIFEPWWFIRTMVVSNLGLMDWELRRQTYLSIGRFTSYLRVLQLEGGAFLIYLFGNLGMRLLGFTKVLGDLRKGDIKKSINVFIYVAIFIAFTVPLIFLQRGVVYNSIQFSQYFLLLFGFMAATSITKIITGFKNKFLRILLSVSIIILMTPTTFGLLYQFYSNKPLAKVSSTELLALNFLKNNTNVNSIILTAPFNQYNLGRNGVPPILIYNWSDTGYVAAFSGRRTLISDAEQIDIMGYNAKDLLKAREDAFNDKTSNSLTLFARNHGVDYIYLNKGWDLSVDYLKLGLEKVFSNTEVDILKVNKL
jgi:hypothetical protein